MRCDEAAHNVVKRQPLAGAWHAAARRIGVVVWVSAQGESVWVSKTQNCSTEYSHSIPHCCMQSFQHGR